MMLTYGVEVSGGFCATKKWEEGISVLVEDEKKINTDRLLDEYSKN